MPTRILLGPQRQRPTVSAVVRELAAPVGLITAGWQENENESPPRGLGRKCVNLGIYARAERVFDRDRELAQAHRERQLELKRLQRLHRVRLDYAVAAWRALAALAEESESPTVREEADAALEAIRALDRHHLSRVDAVHEAFEARWRPGTRDAVAAGREAIATELAGVEAVVVAGGHVAVLLNRMRLFDLAPLLEGKRLVAWSAGAMVCAPRIVLFHDSPPWGAGNAELLDRGLGLFGQVLPLPDPGRRLRTNDPSRVALLARRFAPLACVGLAGRSRAEASEDGWRARATLHLGVDGETRLIGRSEWEALAP